MSQPTLKPNNPRFGSGPCTKRPGYSLSSLPSQSFGRSHRSQVGLGRLRHAISSSKKLLGVPDDYLLGIVPASDTGAFEIAMWSLLGPRTVDVFAWESFGRGWLDDITKQLKITARNFTAAYGELPDLSQADPENDVVFTWNGTTSGVCVPNADWISAERKGLTLCDATSAAFAMDLDWSKLDVVTYSWQKVLGGEGAHGVLILSPRAVERLESHVPAWPMPKIFRLTKAGKINAAIFDGSVINTPSMLCVEDYIDALEWAESIGGINTLFDRCSANAKVIEAFVEANSWVSFLAKNKESRSKTSVCLTIDLPADKIKAMTSLLDKENVAHDIGSYRDAPAGLRIWCGATVETSDLEALMPWLAWAYAQVSEVNKS